ncbi:MAG: type II 3-dehydroquinate dehydratase [Actinomycetota bacterium]|jgi:3-dehydroquinate dehydratase-2|nr:type II 3-dehydroquinate dehydratase [Actinomycetota bacterium]
MKKIIIINGPNLNLLGQREKEIYGQESFEKIYSKLGNYAQDKGVELSYFQSNSEGSIIDHLHQCRHHCDLVIINPGALTHYSYSLHDAILACKLPAIEVHISNIYRREQWRSKSVISPAAVGVICGFGTYVYELALIAAINYLNP